jgi:hypothetical protein
VGVLLGEKFLPIGEAVGNKVGVSVGKGVWVKVGSRVSITICVEVDREINPHPKELNTKIITVAKIGSDTRRRTTGKPDNLNALFGIIASPPTGIYCLLSNCPLPG